MSEIQDHGKFRKNIKDQFYTRSDISHQCFAKIVELYPHPASYLWIEPAAGDGSFIQHLPDDCEKIALDIDPQAPGIIQTDFLQWNCDLPDGKRKIIFGNPPFGRQASIAKSFIRKSCQIADTIAFILPKSFVKPSMYSAFDSKFHLLFSMDLPQNSFLLNGELYDVPTVFQIWEKRASDRPLEEKVEATGFQYVSSEDDYDFAFRRVGALAGKCYPNNGQKYSIQSHYFIKVESSALSRSRIIKEINQHTFPTNTTGPRSLSKSEINSVINKIIVSLE